MKKVQKQKEKVEVLDRRDLSNKAWEVNILDVKNQGYFFTKMEISLIKSNK